jgi:hypothetical protein
VRVRRIAAAAALATAIVVPSAATVAFASSGNGGVTAAHRPEASKSGEKGNKKKSKFAATGTVTAVSVADRTVTIKVRGGTKGLRGTTVTVTVASNARIRVNGKSATVAGLATGYGITVTGTRSGSDYLAARVEARGKRVGPSPSSSASASPSPTESPSESPTVSASASPSASGDPGGGGDDD